MHATRCALSVTVAVDDTVVPGALAANDKTDPALPAGPASTVTAYLVCVDNPHCKAGMLIGRRDLR